MNSKQKKDEKNLSIVTLIINTFLFISKLIIGILFNSIAVISDSLNSLFDIISSFIVYFSIKESHKKPDKKHQFGHTQSQPIAGLVIAILTGIFGFQIFIASIRRFLSHEQLVMGYLPLLLMITVMLVKALLYYFSILISKRTKSVALKAAAVDHRNDVLVSFIVLIGLVLANLGYPLFDPIAGAIISLYVIYSGFSLGKENIDYITGSAPSDEVFDNIEQCALSIKEVIDVNDIRAYMQGTMVVAEVHIYLKKDLSVGRSHEIGKKVQKKIEDNSDIKAFIHIDPYTGKKISRRRF